jgi:FMN phosphatase YigB (HAD superfamily)
VSPVDTFFFCVGGVIVPHIWQATLELLRADAKPADANTQMALYDLEKALCVGAITAEEFCRRAVVLAQASVTPEALAAQIPDWLELSADILSVIDELAPKYRLCLASDYPRAWLVPAMQRLGLSGCFEEDAIFFMADYAPPDYFAAIFDALIAAGALIPERCLWVDDNPWRTAAAVRRGINATIFVDSRRLRRDVALWGLVPPLSPTEPG